MLKRHSLIVVTVVALLAFGRGMAHGQSSFTVEWPTKTEDLDPIGNQALWPFAVHDVSHGAGGHPGWDIFGKPGMSVYAAIAADAADVSVDERGFFRVSLYYTESRDRIWTVGYTNLKTLAPGIGIGRIGAIRLGQLLGTAAAGGHLPGSPDNGFFHFELDDPNVGQAVSPGTRMSAAGLAIFQSVWAWSFYIEELVEPFQSNVRNVSFPLTRTWSRQSGSLPPALTFTRPDAATGVSSYQILDGAGNVTESGQVNLGIDKISLPVPAWSIDLVAASGLRRRGLFNAVDGTLQLQLAPAGADRPADLTGASVYTTQPFTEVPCVYTLSATSRTLDPSAATGTVTVSAPFACTWTATSNSSFIALTNSGGSVTPSVSTAGPGTVFYAVAADGGASRTGSITIAGQTFTVTQAGAPAGACAYTLSATSRSFDASAGSGTIDVSAPSGCAWTATSNASFLSMTNSTGGTLATSSGSGPGTAYYAVALNSGGARTGSVTIAGQTFTVAQAAASTGPCTYALSSTSQSFAASAASGTVAVSTQSSCTWSAISNSSFLTVTNSAGGAEPSYSISGSAMAFFALSANSGALRTGTIAVAGQTFTVTQAGAPTIAASPATLRFGATKAGAAATALSAVTAPQTVTVAFTGAAPPWTASADASWLQITNASGSSTGRFIASIGNPGNVIAGSTNLTATITISAPSANLTTTVPVTLVVQQATTSGTAPFGQVDTPVPSAVLQGAVAVTGWALDDVGVSSVKVYRNCLAFDAPANCQTILGNSVVFVGDAAFVSGARPDVEAAFSTMPQAYRAGWGYLLLTNMLPHVTNSLGYGGQGPLTLFAYATDAEGNVTLLGRSQGDHTPTLIAMANDTIAKPFGAIDTPAQGQTVSGVLNNFGWTLTPDSNTTSDATDILMPVSGSTMTVFIDGVAVGTVGYNQCRGSVGNPVPSAGFCNDDVANIFGNSTPQAVLTARTANATRYRNLDAGRGPIGAFTIDTTTLTNGVHSIAWGVTDTAGRSEGIGSRNFTVLNSGADPSRLADATAMVRGDAASLAALTPTHDTMWGRTGFDLSTAFTVVSADRDGVRHMEVPELGRLELQLAFGPAGYVVANDTLRALPPGSHLDPVTGQFTWLPEPGYLGIYRLVFVGGNERTIVDVTVR